MRVCLVCTEVVYMHTCQHCWCLLYLSTYAHTHQGVMIVYMCSYKCVHLITHKFMVVGSRHRESCLYFTFLHMSVPPHPHPLSTAPCFRFCGSFWSLHSWRGCTAAQQNQRPPVAESPCARFGAWPRPLICPGSGRDAAAASRTQRAAALAASALRLAATWTSAQRRTAPRVAADGPPSALSYFLRCLPCYFQFSHAHIT